MDDTTTSLPRRIATILHAFPRRSLAAVLLLVDTPGSGLRTGASGFLIKDVEPQALIDAVRLVHEGQALLAPQVTRRLIEAFVATGELGRPAPSVVAGLDQLTAREREILALVGSGRSNTRSPPTWCSRRSPRRPTSPRIMTKLGARDSAQLVVSAYEAGLVTAGG
jgi:FixJ family two-component response regulator